MTHALNTAEFDLTNCPPVPPAMYDVVASLVVSGQMPEARVNDLLGDPVFAEWFMGHENARQRKVEERFRHTPLDFVGVADPTLVYVGLADRAAFDRIAVPVTDHGEKDTGHVLTKTVGNLGSGEVSVVFQYWVP